MEYFKRQYKARTPFSTRSSFPLRRCVPIADAHFINAEVPARHFDGDLRLEAEAILLDRDA